MYTEYNSYNNQMQNQNQYPNSNQYPNQNLNSNQYPNSDQYPNQNLNSDQYPNSNQYPNLDQNQYQMPNQIQNDDRIESSYYNQTNGESGKKRFFSVLWKILLIIIVLVLAFFLLLHFKVISFNSSVMPDTVILNVNEIGIKKGSGYQLVSTVLPENSSNKQVVFESSDPSVASVDKDTGYINAINVGTATITVKTLINNKSSQCTVTVGEEDILLTSLTINEKNISLAVGHSQTLSYKTTPTNATELNLNFTSSDPSIATVDSKGVVTAVKEGNVVITISSTNDLVSDTAYVTVYKEGAATVVGGNTVQTNNYPTKVSLSDDKMDISVGTTAKLTATLSPDNSNSVLNWSSSDPSVASVSQDGLITAKNVGSTDIVVKTINNLTATCHVTVGNYSLKVKKITITTSYSLMQIGSKQTLFVAFEPSNASNKSITWTSSNSNVAKVDSSGVVEAVGSGTAVITATSVDGGFTSTSKVEVKGKDTTVPVTSISLGDASRDITVGSTIQITPSVTPSNATYKEVTFTSSDPSVATVDSNGVVSGKKEGKTVITVTTKHENISASVTVNVTKKLSVSVSLNKSAIVLNKGKTAIITATVRPSSASSTKVRFESSDPNVATVSQSGLVFGKSKGRAIITVTPEGGGTSSTCLVLVN